MSTMEHVKTSQPAARGEGGGWFGASRAFLTEVRNEMRRVTWPSRKEVYAATVVVVLTAAFFGLYLWGLDLVFQALVNWIFRQFGAAA
jgi:preprotein translocase subunit SecE